MTVAIAGSPNVGKTTLFNALTGLCQHVGNWPGKTVDIAEGWHRSREAELRLVDLPGTYGLAGNSPEEILTRDFVLGRVADVILVVLEPRALQRHLYLALQVLEFAGPVVLVLNLMDSPDSDVDLERLQAAVRTPVVAVSAARRQGLAHLVKTVLEVAAHPPAASGNLGILDKPVRDLAREPSGLNGMPPRWEALRLLAGDDTLDAALARAGRHDLLQRADEQRQAVGGRVRERLAAILYEQAAWLESLCPPPPPYRTSVLDRLLTHRLLAYPLFGLLVALALWLTLAAAQPLTALLEALFSRLGGAVALFLFARGVSAWIAGPLVDGLIVGVGAVIAVMLPTMSIFFVLLALLEESGLVPRLALAADLPLQRVGSQGRHCLACLVSLGCNVPGVYAARTMTGRPRLLTILTASLIPCNGRLGVMLPLAVLFFGQRATLVVLGLLALSLVTVMLACATLSRIWPESPGDAVMELPPLRWPHLPGVLLRTLRYRVVHVLARASLIAAPVMLAVWLLGNLPVGAGPTATYTATLTAFLQPAGRALGLDGRILTAVLFSLPAKEIVLGALALTGGVARSLGETGAVPLGVLLETWSSFTALKFLVFFTLAAPCAYTMLVIRRESGSTARTALAVGLSLLAGSLATWILHLVGRLLGLG
ncbi:MAG: ferrous iron transport protein B [bacterium]|nr:ferrous iron transport protein B [bacterium]